MQPRAEGALKRHGVPLALRAPTCDPARLPILSQLAPPEQQALLEYMRRLDAPPGYHVVRQGDPADAAYLLVAGRVKVYRWLPEGHERIVALLGAPAWFGEGGLFGYPSRSATVETIEPARLLVLSHHDFERFAREHPHGALRVLRALGQRLLELLDDAASGGEELLRYRASQRVAATVARLARRHGAPSPQGIRIPFRLSHAEIGKLAGVSRETACRALRQLTAAGLLRNIGRMLLIPSLAELESLSRGSVKKGGNIRRRPPSR